MNLSDYRERLDRIDTELLRLFSERMEIASEIGLYKKQNALPLLDRAREEEKLRTLCGACPGEDAPAVRALFEKIIHAIEGMIDSLIVNIDETIETMTKAREGLAIAYDRFSELKCAKYHVRR